MDQRKVNVYQNLLAEVNKREHYLKAKEQTLAGKQAKLRQMQKYGKKAQGMGASGNGCPQLGDATQNLLQNVQNLPDSLVPGNIGAINSIVWPFYFSTDFAAVPPNTNSRNGFTVTQEACFIWMSFTKVVYIQDDDGSLTYIDPEQPGDAGSAYNLSMTIRDAQSSRDFENTPYDMDMVGNPDFPTIYPRPSLFPPNANIEISFTNSDPDLTYCPIVTAFGYRMRLQDANTMLSFVTG